MAVDAFRIAVLGPLTGPSFRLGKEMAQAAQLAVDEKNQSDGIAGRRIELATGDDAGEVARGQALARWVGEQREILAVIGHYNSDVTLAAAPLYHAQGLALVAPIVSNPGLTERGYENVFRFTNRDDRTAAAIAAYLRRELGHTRAAVVETRSTYGSSMAHEFACAFKRLGGEVSSRHVIAPGDHDFETLVRRFPSDVDVMFYGGTFEGAPLLRAARAVGQQHLFATGDGCWDLANFLEPAGEAAEAGEGVLVLSATPELGRVAGSREFARRYERRFGPINNYAVNAYDATRMVLEAIELAVRSGRSEPSRADVVAALRQLQFQGIAYPRPSHWDARGDNLAALTALHVVRDGRFVQVAQLPAAHAVAGEQPLPTPGPEV